MDYFQTIILPILLGIATTVLISVTSTWFQDSFLPRYVEWRASGFSLTGSWKSSTDFPNDDLRAEESISISQRVTAVTGTVQYTEVKLSTMEVKCQKEFQITGTFENMIFCGIYATRRRDDIGRGAYCLNVHDSETLIGQTVVLDPISKQVIPREYTWNRN